MGLEGGGGGGGGSGGHGERVFDLNYDCSNAESIKAVAANTFSFGGLAGWLVCWLVGMLRAGRTSLRSELRLLKTLKALKPWQQTHSALVGWLVGWYAGCLVC